MDATIEKIQGYKNSGESQEPKKLQRTMVIPRGAKFEQAPETVEYCSPHYELVIGIGNDYTASLILTEGALREINRGEELSITVNL